MQKAKVVEVHRTNFILRNETGDFTATVRGSFHDEGEFPKVGDYVEYSDETDGDAVIESILPRQSVIVRRAASSEETQTIAANVDLIFIVMGLDGDFNVSRLERYLTLASQSQIQPVIILNKKDITESLEEQLTVAEEAAGTVPLHIVSAISGEGMEDILRYFSEGTTAVLLGSSGAGKSTITNWLLGEDVQEVHETREDDNRGRHTTTSRQLFDLPRGGHIIDTPGMRELGLTDLPTESEESIISKVKSIAENCKFRNCDHEKSAGCAVLSAIEAGELSERELQNYHKMLREQDFLITKEPKASSRHYEHNQKRQQQKNEQIRRDKLSRR